MEKTLISTPPRKPLEAGKFYQTRSTHKFGSVHGVETVYEHSAIHKCLEVNGTVAKMLSLIRSPNEADTNPFFVDDRFWFQFTEIG